MIQLLFGVLFYLSILIIFFISSSMVKGKNNVYDFKINYFNSGAKHGCWGNAFDGFIIEASKGRGIYQYSQFFIT